MIMPMCDFCSLVKLFCHRLSSDSPSQRTPLLRLTIPLARACTGLSLASLVAYQTHLQTLPREHWFVYGVTKTFRLPIAQHTEAQTKAPKASIEEDATFLIQASAQAALPVQEAPGFQS